MFGLQFGAEEEAVKKDFAECGEIVSFRMPLNKETGESKGMAFCEFATKEAMDKALEYNETDYNGRTLRVRICEPEGEGKGKGKGKDGKGKGKGKDGKGKGKGGKGKGGPSEKPEDCKSIVVKGMSYDTTEETLRGMFAECGSIANCKILTDRETGASKGMAFIDFEDTSATDEAVKKSGGELDGRWIFVDFSGGPGFKGDGKKGDGKGKGKDGKGKGKGKGKKGKSSFDNAIKAANSGSLQEGTGNAMKFDSDDE
jgi:nucleolin